MTGTLRVVGLDLSLASSGLSDGHQHLVAKTPDDIPLEPRLDTIRRAVRSFVGLTHTQAAADLVVMEGPAFSKSLQPGHEELAGVRVMVRLLLWDMGIPYAIVTPTTLKKYTAGHGKATKAQMVKALEERHGIKLAGVVKVAEGRDDMADAAALAAMGYAFVDQPLETAGPPGPLGSLLAVEWPKLPFLVL